MENTKTIFDTWMDAQHKMTNNWVEMNEKLQKSLLGGEMMEKGSELYSEWLENQKNMLNSLMGTTPAAAKETTETTGQATASTPGADLFGNWFNLQNEAMKNWSNTSRSLYENFLNTQKTTSNVWNSNTLQQNWFNTLNNLYGSMTKALTDMPKGLSNEAARDAFSSMLKSTDVYHKLFGMWQPFFASMQSGKFDAEMMKKMFNPTTYKELVDSMFGFTSSNDIMKFFEQSASMISNWYNSSRQLGTDYMNVWRKENDLMEGMMPVGPKYLTDLYRNMFEAYRNSMMPYFRLQAPGREQEQLDSLFSIQEMMTNYAVKTNEMQYLIYANAGKAWNQVLSSLQKRAEEGKEYANFQEFYNEWSDTNEKIFTELFYTEDFSRLQGELLSLGLDIRKSFEKQAEMMLEPYPVVLRSQLDEVYKANYELRKQLRSLEKTVKELKKSVENNATASTDETAKSAATKATAKK